MKEKISFTERLDALSHDAFAAVKTRLATLPGQKYILDKPVTIYIDTCGDSLGFIYSLEAKTVILINDSVEIFAEGFDTDRLEQPLDWDNLKPTEYWGEGGEWYAEWEGLLEVFDKILEEQN